MQTDLYAVLGISRQATAAELKQAYRAAALRDHPDKRPGDRQAEERFKQAARAYAILSDPARRRRYDLFGQADSQSADFDPRRLADQVNELLGEVLGGIFGIKPKAGRPKSPDGTREELLHVPFAVAASGGRLPLQIERFEPCCACAGKGGRSGSPVQRCADCQGSGAWRLRRGIFSLKKTCPACRGSGTRPPESCPACAGSARAAVRCRIDVEVPPGADSGTQLRLPGAGDFDLERQQAGDLLVICQVDAPLQFERQGANLRQSVKISPWTAALGGNTSVIALSGRRQVKVPAGIQTGTVLRLRGQGMPRGAAGAPGDMLVEVVIETPTRLTEAQRALWEQLQDLGPRPTADQPKA